MDCCNDNIILRDARPEDARFIAWVVLTALDMDTEHLDLVTDSVADPESMYSWTNTVMAEADGKPVGCLVSYDGARYEALRTRTWPTLWGGLDPEQVRLTPAETGPGEYYLDSMAVIPEYRGRGSVGKLLMRHVMSKASAQGHKNFALLVDVDKPRLEQYYAGLGFATQGTVDFFGHDFHKMTCAAD